MSKSLLKDPKLNKKTKEMYDKNPEILDIIAFGSAVKGKHRPKDIDILILFSRKENRELANQILKAFKDSGYNADIVTAVFRDLFNTDLLPRENILLEGISMINKSKVSDALGYKSFILFKYNLKKFSKSKRVQFFYALSGRKNDGILKKFGHRLGKDTLLISVEKSDEFKEFLDSWKVGYQEYELLMPARRLVQLRR